jgi:D-proline reductase (dithiol) PrdB
MENRYLRDYEWIINSDIPWKHLAKQVTESKVALITSAGIYNWKTQKHFNLADDNGDCSFREIKKTNTQEETRVSCREMDLNGSVALDYNCIFPLDRLVEMEKEKRVSSASELHFSVMGEIKNPKEFIEDAVPKIVRQLQKFLVDVVIISAVGPLSHQTAGVMARMIEEAEISTIVVGGLKTVFQNVKPPRTLLVRFPFGQFFGAPFDTATQKEILNECLVHVKSIREPGEIAELGYQWHDSFKNALQKKPDLRELILKDNARSAE